MIVLVSNGVYACNGAVMGTAEESSLIPSSTVTVAQIEAAWRASTIFLGPFRWISHGFPFGGAEWIQTQFEFFQKIGATR
jgi:hypothetical protein